ncbi:aminoacetone oxidase family FAD-binding enzyme [Aminipila butyrica]|uniref:Aminoacetone oxidase family FAD-binding enzyme n=1 Tax=Aminipila butyrica TaxID=433296 RepID=A0A858BTT8_9FIRM|nr:aminoacetone oxidase family FAD-binding enzyme [Aminipila butyrica]QIB68977.1 aminoacetone oxidase family FAD-binding enzyme [Aminipila butyrica]
MSEKKSLYNIFFDICVVGGGASGLAAAISSLEENPTLRVCILEKKEDVGKKLQATGNGRCNITNADCSEVELVKSFLHSSGILLTEEEEGRLYPRSGQASSVVELLKWRAKKLNVTIFTSCQVLNMEKVSLETEDGQEEDGFYVLVDCASEKITIPCKKVVLACGGKAAPQFGTTGDGYAIAKSFGHTISKLHPVLMPIQCEGIDPVLKGVRAKGRVALLKGEELVAEELGEVQFTEDGLSGICIFNLSRHLVLEPEGEERLEEAFRNYRVEMDFLPDMEEDEVIEFLKERRFLLAVLPKEVYLDSILPAKLGRQIMEEVVGENQATAGSLTYEGIEEIAMLLKSSRYTVTGAKGWREAQCTGGGIPLGEVCPNTMQSQREPGLYLAGEMLDYDGPCGGYNLQHAWLTGIKAGRGAAYALACPAADEAVQ